MSFDRPEALVALALVPLAVVAYLLLDRRRAARAGRFSRAALLPNLVRRPPGRLRHLPLAVLLVGVTALLVGVARPHATISVPREEATVILAIDTSRSMTAADVDPTRLAAAQAAAGRFLEVVPDTFRVGLVVFADRANVVVPPTDDHELVRGSLGSVRPGEGTALGEAVVLALRAAQSLPGGTEGRREAEPPPASILVLSDGAQTQGEVTPQQAAQRARRAGVPVYTVVLGTNDGIVERTLVGGFTERVRVPPDPRSLQQLARGSGGEHYAAPDDERLQRVYEELGSRLGEREKEAEVTVAFAGAGVALLLVAGALSTLLLRRLP